MPLFKERVGGLLHLDITGTRTYNVKESQNGYKVDFNRDGISIYDPNNELIWGRKKGYEVAAKIAKSEGLTVKDGTKINISSSVDTEGIKLDITAENKESDGENTVDKVEFKPGVDSVEFATAPVAISVGMAAIINQMSDGITAEEAFIFTQAATSAK
ncbi:MAG: hypothetical protein ACQEQF_09565 [Bacillota bacterium]